MKKLIYVLAAVMLFASVSYSIAGVNSAAKVKAHEIKIVRNQSGAEAMQNMYLYLYSLPDNRLIPLMDEVGAERLLAELPGHHFVAGDTVQHQQNIKRQQVMALRNPESKKRICRNIANYLLNTVNP